MAAEMEYEVELAACVPGTSSPESMPMAPGSVPMSSDSKSPKSVSMAHPFAFDVDTELQRKDYEIKVLREALARALEKPDTKFKFFVYPERIRLLFHVNFWIMVILAAFFRGTSDVNPANGAATDARFGAITISGLWNDDPMRSLTALLFPFVEIPMVAYVFLHWLRVYARYHHEGEVIEAAKNNPHRQIMKVSREAFWFTTITAPLQIITAVCSRMMFIMDPAQYGGGNKGVFMQNLPWFGFQLFVLLTVLQNHWFMFDTWSFKWDWQIKRIGHLYVFALCFFSIFRWIGIGFSFSQDKPIPGGFVVDLFWLALAMLFPLASSTLGRDKEPVIAELSVEQRYEDVTRATIHRPIPESHRALPKIREDQDGVDQVNAVVDTVVEVVKDQMIGPFKAGDTNVGMMIAGVDMYANLVKNEAAHVGRFVIVDRRHESLTLSINPEIVRIVGYLSFWGMVMLAVLFSYTLVTVNFSESSALIDVFGYNNICVFWDYEPARTLAALFYPPAEYLFIVYAMLIWLRAYFSYQQGLYRLRRFVWMTICFAMIFMLIIYFRMIFVVSAMENMFGHSVGFVGLQVALCLISVQNQIYLKASLTAFEAAHAKVKKGWRSVRFQVVKQGIVGYVYVGSLCVATFLKMYMALAAMANWRCHTQDCGVVRFSQAMDVIWMILAAIMPIFLGMVSRAYAPKVTIKFVLPFDKNHPRAEGQHNAHQRGYDSTFFGILLMKEYKS